ncbi:xylosyltransferase oxt [Diabrotica undecimpunctata]|uniref:xylosyltransferase oxt n=1 Tax=Diabrotica undecimpunctata TaxID=50387 RepID=UPI003B637AC1
MVKSTSKNSKWIRRYRTFFIIGIVILAFQIYLAVKFLSINKSIAEPNDNKWLSVHFDDEQEADVNSANKLKTSHDYEVSSVVQTQKTKDKINHTYSLKYEDLDFVPACQISSKEAVSAINRAKTQTCKQFISNITCLSLKNELYPKELKGLCPNGDFIAGKELGCFKDEKNFRLLTGYFGISKKDNSPKYCMRLCLQSGFPYAGVQYSNECFCGVDEPPLTSKVPDSSCNLKCPGDAHATCGGYYTMNVYHTGIKRFIPQTANIESDNKTRSTVKIVFLLTLNGRALRQIKRLLKILYHKDHYYYIHIDIRQDYLYRELLPLEQILPNVRLTRKRFATIWGGASLLEMLRSCMWELLNMKEWKWDFVLNLSESDFPVKPVQKLSEFLTLNKNRNFVKSHGREVQRFIQKQGLDKTFVECEYRMWRIGDRSLPSGIQMDGGSDWIALSKSFVEYVTDPVSDDLITGLLKIFKHTLLPAESFFHTALRNSKFCDTYIDNNLHVTNWKRKLGCKCQYKHIVDWCGCSPNNFRPEDWPRIVNTLSRQLYFARKFEPVVNQAVILQLELWLCGLDAPSRSVVNLHGYWQNLYHHRDLEVTKNDALLTISNSVKRHAMKMLNNDTCYLNTLLEVTSYHFNDSYQYTLFKFDISDTHSIELAIKPLNKNVLSKNSTLMSHLDFLTVATDYDQKEQMSRNFLRIMSPFSEPLLIYSFSRSPGSKIYNLTSIWIGPDGQVHDVVDFSVDSSSLLGNVKAGLKQPILPGIWNVKIVYKNFQLSETKFLITPLEYFNRSPVRPHQVTYLHGGPKDKKDFKNSFGKFLPPALQKQEMERSSLANSLKTDVDLTKWVDELFLEFYSIKKSCESSKLSRSVQTCGVELGKCEESRWSSLAPDPKSAIGQVNLTTGTFDIW